MQVATELTTYEEKSAADNRRGAESLFPLIIKAWEAGSMETKAITSNTVAAANSSREIGIYLQELCGHENMSLSFWKGHCEKKLPFDFDAAKAFISIARRMERKAKTLDDVRDMQLSLMIAFGEDEAPERSGVQSLNTVPPLQKLACCFTALLKPFQKLVSASPMKSWTPYDLKTFLSETEWVSEERQRAEKLLREAK